MLDLCCYTGGFAVQAKCLGQAAEVTGVEIDEEPLRLARENANLNQARIRFVQADAFAYMRDMLAQARQYDVVVLDPPKLVRSRAELEEGTRKHFDLNRLAMRLVAPRRPHVELLLLGPLEGATISSASCAPVRTRRGRCLTPADDDAPERHAAAADADPRPHRRRRRPPGHRRRAGDGVSQGRLDAAGIV